MKEVTPNNCVTMGRAHFTALSIAVVCHPRSGKLAKELVSQRERKTGVASERRHEQSKEEGKGRIKDQRFKKYNVCTGEIWVDFFFF